MSRCECRPGSDTFCGWCEAAISRVEENRIFGDSHTQRDLDWMADAEAAEDWAARGGAA